MADEKFWQRLVRKLRKEPGQEEQAEEASSAPAEPTPPQDVPAEPEPQREPEQASPPVQDEPAPAPAEPEQAEPEAQPTVYEVSGAQRVPEMMTQTDRVSDVYAQSLFELARDADVLDAAAEELADVAALLDSHEKFRVLIESPALSGADRRGSIEGIFKGRVSDLTYRFLLVLSDKDRLAAIPGISAAYSQKLADHKGIVHAQVRVARALTSEEAERLSTALGEALGGKTIVLHQEEQPELIGGLAIQIGDRLFDASVSAQLRQIKKKLIAEGREKARLAVQSGA